MATIFTRIIDGELPGRFVWRDDLCVAFLSINPLNPGHTLVVPRQEVDHWLDLDDALAAHLTQVARRIGAAQMQAFAPERVGLMIAGLEVPHVHLHVVPINGVARPGLRPGREGPRPQRPRRRRGDDPGGPEGRRARGGRGLGPCPPTGSAQRTPRAGAPRCSPSSPGAPSSRSASAPGASSSPAAAG